MKAITATEARKNLRKLMDEILVANQPILISGKRKKAVLISEGDWRSIQETIYLSSIHNMRESIVKGLETPIIKCDDKLTF